MNEETEKLLNEALAGAIDAVKTTGNFVVEQAPDLIRQLLLYNTVMLSAWVLLGVVVLIATGLIVRKAWKWEKTLRGGDSGVGLALGGISFVIGGILGCTLIFGHISELIKIVLAPKIWLLEYAASLVK